MPSLLTSDFSPGAQGIEARAKEVGGHHRVSLLPAVIGGIFILALAVTLFSFVHDRRATEKKAREEVRAGLVGFKVSLRDGSRWRNFACTGKT